MVNRLLTSSPREGKDLTGVSGIRPPTGCHGEDAAKTADQLVRQ
jgi:hypothetical protein